MRVLLYGEGNHDVGELVWDKRTREWAYLEGWMQPFIRRMLGADVTFVPTTRRDVLLLPRDQKGLQPLPVGHGGRALAALLKARSERCEAAVFMADADTADEKEWRMKRAEVQAGFDRNPTDVKPAACLPMATSECWLLADRSAWESVGRLRQAFELPVHPELSWGKRDDPRGDHPKHLFSRTCAAFALPDGRDTRLSIATASDISVVGKLCPISFEDFRNGVASLIQK